jgi:hypothetical protein
MGDQVLPASHIIASWRDASLPKLPVWRLVGESYAFVAQNSGQALRASCLPVLTMVPLFVLANWLVASWQPPHVPGTPADFVTSIPRLLQLPFLASVAVAWHRLVLRGDTIEGWFVFRLDDVVWKYAGVVFGLQMLAMFAGSSVAGAFGRVLEPPAAVLIEFAIAVFALPRLSLMLPAIALHRDISIVEAWRATRANTWRLAVATLLCLLPPILLFDLALVYVARSLDVSGLVTMPIAAAVGMTAMTVPATLLSRAFDRLLGAASAAPAGRAVRAS